MKNRSLLLMLTLLFTSLASSATADVVNIDLDGMIRGIQLSGSFGGLPAPVPGLTRSAPIVLLVAMIVTPSLRKRSA